MNINHPTFLLRLGLAVVLFAHSIPSIVSGSIYDFGKLYLDVQGFAPFGLPLAWAIKITHIICAICLLVDKYIVIPIILMLVILIAGIIMVHLPDGWFVVGFGRNGIEFNFILIMAFLSLLVPEIQKKFKRD